MLDYNLQLKQLNNYLLHPAIFIGGSMSSGTSLVRSILDVHPSVKCGPETKFINILLDYLKRIYTKDRESLIFMKAAGIKNQTLDKSIGLAVYYVMLMNVERNVERLCNKETSNRRHIEFFKNVFPYSKFILVIRDGREVAFSLMKRSGGRVTFKRYFGILKEWNYDNLDSYNQCVRAGKDFCMIVRYESLVTAPETEIRKMINFLGVEWNERVLNHEKYVNSDVKMSETEWSRAGTRRYHQFQPKSSQKIQETNNQISKNVLITNRDDLLTKVSLFLTFLSFGFTTWSVKKFIVIDFDLRKKNLIMNKKHILLSYRFLLNDFF
ncbi:hypothetical protein BpHYR1_005161 [Brachionus plicatilis]|uniref:Protein-tyrosine sulfotransferase n=1 Tax=Brachionus plicatilis TaxID=10195 RepID=A0A3M7R104_BRAPC|nr:hypothetical protein BpHYR1_005161 [Brachionus plicatilis]